MTLIDKTTRCFVLPRAPAFPLFDKRLRRALRLDENPPSRAALSVKTTRGGAVKYELVALPIYLAWRARELAGP